MPCWLHCPALPSALQAQAVAPLEAVRSTSERSLLHAASQMPAVAGALPLQELAADLRTGGQRAHSIHTCMHPGSSTLQMAGSA